jgi:hypothetical protein
MLDDKIWVAHSTIPINVYLMNLFLQSVSPFTDTYP